jgi:Mn2+/Fe2+ NRAMP family transporter
VQVAEPPGRRPPPSFAPSADRRGALDRAHVGDIEGALGTVASFDTGPRLTRWRRIAALVAILGPGLIVMAADNDAGTISVFAQAGQDHGVRLLWVLALLSPILYVSQEMAIRLGAVTGSGHARLILERFGRVWCAFSLGDLLVLNFAILVTEFIGVALSLSYFGVSRYVAVPLAAAGLILVTAGGSFRRWERAMYLLVAGDLGLIPLAAVDHPRPSALASGLLPGLGHATAGSTLLLLVALVGTTIAPWQIFFQQSNVIDKRITPRWLAYERIDTALGALVFTAAAAAVMITCAAAFGGGPAAGHFSDAGVIARDLGQRLGAPAGAMFAFALLNASLLGAGAISLSGAYSASEVLGVKHSLHRGFRDAATFHGCFAGLIVAAAATVLIPRAPLGTVTTLVQALAGVLLPSTLVLLLMLCNDEQLLGPLTNARWLNVVGTLAVGVILGLSTVLTITTIRPGTSVAHALLAAFGLLGAGGVVLARPLLRERRRNGPRDELTPWERETWTAPMLELVQPASRTRPRVLGLALLRGYTIAIVALLLVRLGSLVAR